MFFLNEETRNVFDLDIRIIIFMRRKNKNKIDDFIIYLNIYNNIIILFLLDQIINQSCWF